jgi:hypothetical protein
MADLPAPARAAARIARGSRVRPRPRSPPGGDAAFPESECRRCASAHPCSISVARCRRESTESVGRGKELCQRGKLRPTANASSAARSRRARAASQVRCRNIHKVSAIRVPPGNHEDNRSVRSESAYPTGEADPPTCTSGHRGIFPSANAASMALSNRVPELTSEPGARYQSAHKRFTSTCELDDHHVGHLRAPEKCSQVG